MKFIHVLHRTRERPPRADLQERLAVYSLGEIPGVVASGRLRTPAYVIDEQMGCWVWQRARTAAGYGSFSFEGVDHRAHRWFYEQLVGPIPEGLVIDHLCRNRACVNPDHLEPVTNAENMRRGFWAQKTHCANGHPFDEANTYWRPDGWRDCRVCKRAARLRYVAKLREGNAT